MTCKNVNLRELCELEFFAGKCVPFWEGTKWWRERSAYAPEREHRLTQNLLFVKW